MTMTQDSNRFSVNNTRVRKLEANGQFLVEKTIRCNVQLPFSTEEIDGLVSMYRELLLSAGVKIPGVTDSKIVEDSIVYLCEDGGKNLVELCESPDVLVKDYPEVVAAAISVLKQAADAGISIDPHIKNFVGEGTDLLYVDFSPPLVEPYINVRCSVASGAEEARILRENFSYFAPKYLAYHFAGDFLDLDSSADRLFPELRALLIEGGLLPEVSTDEFAAKAHSIRALEDLRLQKQIFMF